jgi:hypothetical protein
MNKKEIQTRLRKITLQLEEGKEWTAADQEVQDKYVALHELVFEQNLKIKTLHDRYQDFNKQVDAHREELQKVKQASKHARTLADKLSETVGVYNPGNVEEFVQAVNDCSEVIAVYHTILEKMGPVLGDYIEQLDAIQDEEDVHEEEFDEFSTILMEHNKNYEINAIDIVKFDFEQDMFRAQMSLDSSSNDKMIQRCHDVVHNYNTLMLESDLQYQVWNEFNKRVSLLQMIADDGSTTINMN